MIYCIILVVLTLLLGCIVPFAQYLFFGSKLNSRPSKLLFSKMLLDYDMDNLKYEKACAQTGDLINRISLNNRGWVRGPNGIVMSEEDFEFKKKREYDIALP